MHSKVSDGRTIVCMTPKILVATLISEGFHLFAAALTRTAYCLPARIQGDSVKEKNKSAGSSKTFN